MRARLLATFLLALVAVAPAATREQAAAPAGGLLDRIWRGVKDAEAIGNGCGTLTETRVSPLMTAPLVLRGTFCAAGRDRFRLDYAPPHLVRLIYNDGALNVSLDGGKRTEAFYVRDSVVRGQEYFSGPRARQNLERDFSISPSESADGYRLLLLPVSGRIAKRVSRIVVLLRKSDFLPRRLEIDGTSGVKSTYEIRVERLNVPLNDSMFQAYDPRGRK